MAKCFITLEDTPTETGESGVTFHVKMELSEEEREKPISAAMLLTAHYGHIFNDQSADLGATKDRLMRETRARLKAAQAGAA
jgi:hypothetical protein